MEYVENGSLCRYCLNILHPHTGSDLDFTLSVEGKAIAGMNFFASTRDPSSEHASQPWHAAAGRPEAPSFVLRK
jgi:hypothetical protein